MHHAYLLLGSNIEPAINLPAAVAALAQHGEVAAVSPVYETRPVGGPSQPNFYNMAALLLTPLEADDLKWQVLRPIEAALGRTRTGDRNAPRSIDVDIALFDEAVFQLDGNCVPDPDILVHAHVALPLAAISPRYVHPVTGESLSEIARSLDFEAHIRGVRSLEQMAGGRPNEVS